MIAVHESLNFSTISSIQCEIQQGNCVDESLVTTVSGVSLFDQLSSNASTG